MLTKFFELTSSSLLTYFYNNIGSAVQFLVWMRGVGSVKEINPLMNSARWRRCRLSTSHEIYFGNFSFKLSSQMWKNTRLSQRFYMFQNINNLLFSLHTKYYAATDSKNLISKCEIEKDVAAGFLTSGCLPSNLNARCTH